jgi:uncharacterized protein (DUF2267 family)
MSQTGVAAFDHTLQVTNGWLREVQDGLGWVDRHAAYHAVRAVLHALRDRLPPDQALALAAQLPMLVRGFYFEGWRPGHTPLRERHKGQFLAHVAAAFRNDPDVVTEEVVRVVFGVLDRHVSGGEIDAVKKVLPEEIRSLWQRPPYPILF